MKNEGIDLAPSLSTKGFDFANRVEFEGRYYTVHARYDMLRDALKGKIIIDEASLRFDLKKLEDWFARNPHDEYFGYNHGKIDAIKKMLGSSSMFEDALQSDTPLGEGLRALRTEEGTEFQPVKEAEPT